MIDESTPNPYQAVLADLKAKRAEIDTMIAAIEKFMALGGSLATGSPSPAHLNPPPVLQASGMFLGLSIVDAAKKLLAARRRQMGTQEITDELGAGGLMLTGDSPSNTVGSVLSRHAATTGEIVRVGRGQWALAEWFPNPQRFKPKIAKSVVAQLVSNALDAATEEPKKETPKPEPKMGGGDLDDDIPF